MFNVHLLSLKEENFELPFNAKIGEVFTVTRRTEGKMLLERSLEGEGRSQTESRFEGWYTIRLVAITPRHFVCLPKARFRVTLEDDIHDGELTMDFITPFLEAPLPNGQKRQCRISTLS